VSDTVNPRSNERSGSPQGSHEANRIDFTSVENQVPVSIQPLEGGSNVTANLRQQGSRVVQKIGHSLEGSRIRLARKSKQRACPNYFANQRRTVSITGALGQSLSQLTTLPFELIRQISQLCAAKRACD